MGDFNAEYRVFKDYNKIFDERKNNFGTIRVVQWVKPGTEPDIAKAKLELRHIVAKDEGEEYGKGYVFNTEEGPHELTEAMVDIGFGNTKNILKSLVKREDFKESVDTINDDPDSDDYNSDMFDMRNLMTLMNESNEEEE